METTKSAKVYVAVLAAFAEDGVLLPRKIRWEDGHQYVIDRVLECVLPPHRKPEVKATVIRFILKGNRVIYYLNETPR